MEFQLVDDGTLDTVVRWECPHCLEANEERFSQEYAASHRDPATGQLDLSGMMDEFQDLHCDLHCGACGHEARAASTLQPALTYIEQRLTNALNSLRHPADHDDISAARDSINEALGYLKGYFE